MSISSPLAVDILEWMAQRISDSYAGQRISDSYADQRISDSYANQRISESDEFCVGN